MRRCASVAGSAVCSITGPGCRRDGAAGSAPGMSASGVVWITGAGSGIGRATALRFLRAGAIVAGTARRVETLEAVAAAARDFTGRRSEEHTSELQSLMRISYAVFCLKKQKKQHIVELKLT